MTILRSRVAADLGGFTVRERCALLEVTSALAVVLGLVRDGPLADGDAPARQTMGSLTFKNV